MSRLYWRAFCFNRIGVVMVVRKIVQVVRIVSGDCNINCQFNLIPLYSLMTLVVTGSLRGHLMQYIFIVAPYTCRNECTVDHIHC